MIYDELGEKVSLNGALELEKVFPGQRKRLSWHQSMPQGCVTR